MFVSSSLRLVIYPLVREPGGLRRPDVPTVRLCKTHFQKTLAVLADGEGNHQDRAREGMADLVAFAVDYRRNSSLKLVALLRQAAARITTDHVGDLTDRIADIVVHFLAYLAEHVRHHLQNRGFGKTHGQRAMLVPGEPHDARDITLQPWRLALEEWLADLRLCKGH